jgi:biopolymer transport protein ExbB
MVVAMTAWGQSGAAAVPAAAAGGGLDLSSGELPSWIWLFKSSPTINGVIAVLSIIAVLLFMYFLVTISSAALAPTTFVDEVGKLVINQKYDEAANLCRANPRVFVSTVIQRCVENTGKQHSVILEMIDSEGRRRADIIWNRISYLADISNVTPMLGLLGTVMGMIKAFFSLEDQGTSVSSAVLTRGIAEAMSTTMFGLVVAILATVFYTIVKARATKALATGEQVVHSIADHIKRGGE